MSQKLYLYILRAGICLSLISVFLVFKNLLFPFITSKQIFFNVVTEALFVFWLVFIIKYPVYKPKWNYIGFGLIAFFTALVISSIAGVDFNLSFWGDIERMLGVFHLLHFLAFYFIIITVFRQKQDWFFLLGLSSLFAVFVAINSLSKADVNHYASIGNTAYVSAYMIFNIYFSLILFFQGRKYGSWWHWLFLAGIPFYLLSMRAASTSGAYVGLGSSLLAILFLYGILNKRIKVKVLAISLFLAITFFFAYILVINRESRIVASNDTLKNFVGEINIHKDTFQTRLISWRAAFKGFKEQPYFGSGYGNFAIIFDKYFDPKFYDQTRGETYFDRAHNNLIDILATSGAISLLAYLSIFVVAGFYLIQGYRKDKVSLHEFVLVSSLIIAYFVQNLAVFDSMVTYMGLMMTLGLVYWLYERPQDDDLPPDTGLNNKEIYAFVIIGIIVLVIMNQYNLRVYKMLDLTIAGQRAWASGDIKGTIEAYRKALSYDTVLDRDSRTSLNRLFISNPEALDKVSREEAAVMLDYNIQLAELNNAYNRNDSLDQMVLAQLLNVAASFYRDDQEKFEFYSGRALDAINASIAASPGRVPVYFQKAQVYLTKGDSASAIDTLRQATTLSDTYYDSFCYLGRTLLFYKQNDEGWKNIDKCVDLNGAKVLNDANQIKIYINHYLDSQDYERVKKLYVALTSMETKNYENWIKLAKLYADTGEKEQAIAAVNQAIAINPAIEKYAQDFLKQLEQ